MAKNTYIDEFDARLNNTLGYLFKFLAVLALLGGICGALMGAAAGAVPRGVQIIEITAGVFAVFLGATAAQYGYSRAVGMFKRSRSFLMGAFAAVFGAFLGGMLASLVLLALGAACGALIGWLAMQAIVAMRGCGVQRFIDGLSGAMIGMFVGAVLWAMMANKSAALPIAASGSAIGAVAAPVLLLIYLATLRLLRFLYQISSERTSDDK